MAFFDMLLMVIVLTIASCIGLLIHVPFVGALIRYRSNYTPKGLQLDQDGQPQPYVGPVIPKYVSSIAQGAQLTVLRVSYFSMLVRIKRIEVRFISHLSLSNISLLICLGMVWFLERPE